MTRVRMSLLAMMALLVWAMPSVAQAQTGTVAGRIFDDASMRPIEGVTLTVVGTDRTGLTNADGRFVITAVPVGEQIVLAQVLGFADETRTVTVTADQTAIVDFQMTNQAIQLQEIVVTGYGEQRAEDVTGVIDAVGTEEFNRGVITAPEELIAGKVAGVAVSAPGFRGDVNIRIRGGTSINASNEPLFVIDGVPISPGGGIGAGSNPLSFINPQDIESVTVLKDASAAAIYGSRGANGVILIETKGGSPGSSISYTGSVNVSNGIGDIEFLGADDFRSAVESFNPSSTPLLLNANTDWRDEILRSGYGQEHNLTVTGGSETSNYRLSAGYFGRDGIVEGSDTERLTAALNFNQFLFNETLSVEANVRGSRIQDNFEGNNISNATGFAPTQPVFNEDGSYYEWDAAAGLSPENPFPEIENIIDQGTQWRSLGSLRLGWDIPWVNGLTATSNLGYDITKADNVFFAPSFLKSQEGANPGRLSRSNDEQLKTLFDAYLTYTRPFGENHNFSATGGYSYENQRTEFPEFFANGLSADFLGPNGIPDANEVGATLDVQESRLISFFGRVNYDYAGKYLFTGSLRRDGSSRFGPEEEWGIFPSAAFAWRISEEGFLEDGPFSDLKLRLSWGITGNQEFDDYQQYVAYQISDPFARVQFGDRFVTTIRPSAADPGIKWEETTSWNAGLDFGFADNRFTAALDVYRKDTDDLIFTVPVASGTNLSDFVTTNVGALRNEGVEFTLSAGIFEARDPGDFRWDATFNMAYNQNEITRINALGSEAEQILTGDIAGGVGNTIKVLQPGYDASSFHAYRHIRDENGNPIYEDVDGNGVINEQDLYMDLNGDGTVNQDDRQPFEQSAPDFIIGHSSYFSFGSFDLTYALRAQIGNHVYNNVASDAGNYSRLIGVVPYSLHASVRDNQFEDPQYFSDVYIEDASFLRMDNITLGYTFGGLGALDGARIFATVQNAFTITGYSGLDPESLIAGIDNNLYPRARTFSLGLTLGF